MGGVRIERTTLARRFGVGLSCRLTRSGNRMVGLLREFGGLAMGRAERLSGSWEGRGEPACSVR